jgi:drug/metabolite transporter (DMT)-like permease
MGAKLGKALVGGGIGLVFAGLFWFVRPDDPRVGILLLLVAGFVLCLFVVARFGKHED